MGLDIVELVMEIEKAFEISVPDVEWETVATINQTVEKIKQYKALQEPERNLFGEVFANVSHAFDKMGLIRTALTPETRLDTIFPKEGFQQSWTDFEKELDLCIPPLTKADFGVHTPERRIFGIPLNKPVLPFLESDISRLVYCICVLNCERLIDRKNICGEYEILILVSWITLEKSGADLSDLYPDSSFTNDLGMD